MVVYFGHGGIGLKCLLYYSFNYKLLGFAKPSDYVYQLSSKAVFEVAFENRLDLKKLVIVEHHNLKITRFPYLQGLYYRKESRCGADFDGLTADSDVFKDGFCHHY